MLVGALRSCRLRWWKDIVGGIEGIVRHTQRLVVEGPHVGEKVLRMSVTEKPVHPRNGLLKKTCWVL